MSDRELAAAVTRLARAGYTFRFSVAVSGKVWCDLTGPQDQFAHGLEATYAAASHAALVDLAARRLAGEGRGRRLLSDVFDYWAG